MHAMMPRATMINWHHRTSISQFGLYGTTVRVFMYVYIYNTYYIVKYTL